MNIPLVIRIRTECKANIQVQIYFVKVLQGSADFANFWSARLAAVSLGAEGWYFIRTDLNPAIIHLSSY
jgi:hypothetical protein